MSRISLLAHFVLLCSVVIDSSILCAQDKSPGSDVKDPRAGSRILITTAGAELRTPEATVWRGYIGEVFTVTLTNGEWLWIDEKGGWLWEQDCTPYETAVETMTKRATEMPSAETLHLRGVAYLSHGEFDKAIADFTESLKREPRNAGALNNRGQARYMKDEYQAAIQDFSAAIAMDARHSLALNNRALAKIAMGDFPGALKDLDAALKLVPDYPEALNNRGIVKQELDRPDDAIKDFTVALKVYPKYIDALCNRALAHLQKDDHVKAFADLEQAITIEPNSYGASNDLAWLLATTPVASVRNPKRALELATKACELSHYEQWNSLDTLATAFAENGKFDEAKQWIGTAIELAPEDEKERLQSHLDQIMAGKPVRD